jgi:hypothetical protein
MLKPFVRNRGYLHHTHESILFLVFQLRRKNSNGIVNEEELEREWNREEGKVGGGGGGGGVEVVFFMSPDPPDG